MTAAIVELLRPAGAAAEPAPAEPAPAAPAAAREEVRNRRGSTERAAIGAVAAALFCAPLLRPSGPGNFSPVDLFTLAALALAAIWATTSGRKLHAPYALGFALLMIAGSASGLLGPLPGTSLLALVQDALLFGWCTVVANVTARPRAMRTALVAWSCGAIFFAGIDVAAWFGHIRFLEGLTAADGNRVMFLFGDPNYAAVFWVMSIFVVYATKAPKSRWYRLAGYALLVWALVLTESNGGMLELLVGVAAVLVIKGYRRRGAGGALATLLVLVLLLGGVQMALPLSKVRQWARNSNQSFLVNSLGRSDNSSGQRSVLIHESLQLYAGGNKVLGFGPNTTKKLLYNQQYPYAKMAHDDYLAALVERGPLGLLGLTVLIGCLAFRTARVVKRPLSGPFAAAVPRPAGLVACVFVVAVAATYYQVLHFRFVWALFALIAVLAAQTQAVEAPAVTDGRETR
jgi:hypothetical protein